MNVRTIALSDISGDDLRRWRDLAERAISPNPLSEPECVLPAAQHLRNGDRIELVVAEEGDRLLACFPLQRVARWRSIPRPVLSTRIRRMTWDGTPLVDSDRAEDAIAAVLDELAATRGGGHPHLLALEWLNERGPLGEIVRNVAGNLKIPWRTYATWVQPFITTAAARDVEFHSKKTLASRERKLRRLCKELGGEAEIVDLGAQSGGPASYVELEASGYKASGGVAMTTQPGEVEWFLDMASRFASEGRFHILALKVADTIVAMECLIRANKGFSMVKWSYDERFEKHSPGAQLHLSTHAWLREQTDADWLDVCTFENNRFALGEYPENRPVSTTVFGLHGPRDRAWLSTISLDRALRAAVFWVGGRAGVNGATLVELCEGGGYGRLDWHRTSATGPGRAHGPRR